MAIQPSVLIRRIAYRGWIPALTFAVLAVICTGFTKNESIVILLFGVAAVLAVVGVVLALCRLFMSQELRRWNKEYERVRAD